MATYAIRRIWESIPTLFGILVLAFFALSFAPGDALTALMDPELLSQLTEEQRSVLRREMGLDQPTPVRFVIWLSDIFRGNLGYSVVNQRMVGDALVARLPPTLLLMSAAALVGIPLGIGIGIVAATHQYSLVDYLATGFSTALISIPGFVVGLVLVYFFGARLKILPTTGMVSLGKPFDLWDLFLHMIMPVSLLGLALSARVARYTRTSMLEVMSSDFITAARAKGVRPRPVLWHHCLRNALLPIITVVGLTLPDLVAGAVITEAIFGWAGMGQLAVKAAAGRDAPLMMGVILVVAPAVLFSTIISDVAYAYADPRIQLDRKS